MQAKAAAISVQQRKEGLPWQRAFCDMWCCIAPLSAAPLLGDDVDDDVETRSMSQSEKAPCCTAS
jgi:hypothetical protein